MPKTVSFRSRLLSVLFWAVISAAFIGPGTVTTAASAGATYGLTLIWALVFSTIACVILQEAAARVTLASGHTLGEAIAIRYQYSPAKYLIIYGVAGTIILGGIAYQAGNILGAVAGLALMLDIDAPILTLLLGICAGLLLWWGNHSFIAKFLGVVVAIMGIAFIWVATQMDWSWADLLQASLRPLVPRGSSWLIIGLIGTTIVPYNLFLASGISKNQSIGEMRWGIITAIMIGGIISMAILLVGTGISGEFSFEALSAQMRTHIGSWAPLLFGVGLFAAGFTSSITAPLAAAITAQSLFGREQSSWEEGGRNYRLVWGIVLLSGLAFGISGIKPIPAIILAQAVNGILLPFIAVFLLLIINEPKIIPPEHQNNHWINLLMLFIVGISSLLGLTNVLKAIYKAFSLEFPSGNDPIYYLTAVSVLIVAGVAWQLYRQRAGAWPFG